MKLYTTSKKRFDPPGISCSIIMQRLGTKINWAQCIKTAVSFVKGGLTQYCGTAGMIKRWPTNYRLKALTFVHVLY